MCVCGCVCYSTSNSTNNLSWCTGNSVDVSKTKVTLSVIDNGSFQYVGKTSTLSIAGYPFSY